MITKCATDKSHFEAFCHLRIQSECGKNADQNNFKCGHFLRSVLSSNLNASLAQILQSDQNNTQVFKQGI